MPKKFRPKKKNSAFNKLNDQLRARKAIYKSSSAYAEYAALDALVDVLHFFEREGLDCLWLLDALHEKTFDGKEKYLFKHGVGGLVHYFVSQGASQNQSFEVMAKWQNKSKRHIADCYYTFREETGSKKPSDEEYNAFLTLVRFFGENLQPNFTGKILRAYNELVEYDQRLRQ